MTQIQETFSVKRVQKHYDGLAFLYKAFWGQHLHHGYWDGDESPAEAQENLIKKLVQEGGLVGQQRILDIGCGLGGSSRWLAKNLGCDVTGITISPRQAKIATDLAKKEGLSERTHFQVMDAHQLSFPAESFDVVWVVECSEHLMDKKKFFSDVSSLLKPGGKLIVCAWLDGSSSPKQEALVDQINDRMILPSMGRMEEYTGWMEEAGLKVDKADDITVKVSRTWDICADLAQGWKMKTLVRFLDEDTRRFVESFPMMREAYETGAMIYGFFVGQKSI